jgi:hypothetical protein
MIYNLIITALLVASFLMCVSAYLLGVKHGKCMSKGNVPPQPIKAVTDPIQRRLEEIKEEPMLDAIQNILSYDGSVALDHIKKQQGR